MTRKQSLSFLALLMCIFFGALCASATTYTVKAGGGGNYTTIQACVNAMAAGDTCTVYAGTYNETVTISAGTAGNYNTVNVNGSDVVTINGGTTINSHTKLIGFRIAPASFAPSCVTIASNATDWYVTNNIMSQCGRNTGEAITEPRPSTISFGHIQGNTISYPCTNRSFGGGGPCAGMSINGSHHLIENNDISHVSDGVTLTGGAYNVYRNNTMHDSDETECTSHSPVNGGNCHIDFISSEPGTPDTQANTYNLYEGNTELNCTGGDCHVFLAQGDGCAGCTNLILRYNHVYNIGSIYLLNDLGGFPHVKSYNNTIVRVNGQDLYAIWNTNTYGAVKNELMVDAAPNSVDWYNITATTGFSAGHNLAYITSCAPSCTFSTTSGFGMGQSGVGNITNQNPLFVNATSDWHLQAGSPAIGAGGPLTTVTSATGSGSSIVVADADYFQDGMGLTAVGVQPDWIRIGASTTVQISSINYSTRVITLASPISWTTGSPVYLYKDSAGKTVLSGSAPDLGAFPYGMNNTPPPPGPPPPTKLVLLVH